MFARNASIVSAARSSKLQAPKRRVADPVALLRHILPFTKAIRVCGDRMCSLRATVAILITASTPAMAEDHLSVIERSLTEQYSSIQSVEVKFRIRSNAWNLSPEEKSRVAEFTHWEWLRSDTKRLIRKEPERLIDGQMSLIWYSFGFIRGFGGLS